MFDTKKVYFTEVFAKMNFCLKNLIHRYFFFLRYAVLFLQSLLLVAFRQPKTPEAVLLYKNEELSTSYNC